MQFELLRAHQRFLPLIGQRRRRTDDEAELLTSVSISPAAENTLLNALSAGAPQSGPLFGYRDQGDLSIHYAAARGYSAALAPGPLAVDPLYLLGLTDAYRQTDHRLDWAGQWLTVRGGRLPDARECLQWFEMAVKRHLVTSEHPLVIAGWQEARFTLLACRMTAEEPEPDEPGAWLPVRLLSEGKAT